MTVAEPMTEIADRLLGSFTPAQHSAATWAFDDAERRQWFYTPTDHGGLPLSDMTATQHRMVWHLVATALSEPGYNTTAVIVGQENVLDRVEGFAVDWGRERGRDPLLYWIAIFGTPSPSGTWGWRFGGHHVSLNFVMRDNRVVSATPLFLGADPASAPLLGPHLHRPLGGAEDLGRELVRSLDAEQAGLAVVSSAPSPDIITANRTTIAEGDYALGLPYVWRGRFEADVDKALGVAQSKLEASLGGTPEELQRLAFSTSPKGIAATALRADQREVLTALLRTYVGRIHDDLADEQMAKLTSSFDELHFLWAGGTEPGEPHYYRVQGGDLFVEFDQAPRDGNHVHTVWRDLSLDFGRDPLADHYTQGHTH